MTWEIIGKKVKTQLRASTWWKKLYLQKGVTEKVNGEAEASSTAAGDNIENGNQETIKRREVFTSAKVWYVVC